MHVGDDLETLRTFPDRYFDWVYLDTSSRHSVKELDLLHVKVKANGIIGRRLADDPAHRHHGVCRAVREFMAREPYELLYANETDKQWAIRRRAEPSACGRCCA